ncbi:MAG: hypothetical protein RR054_05030 [Clostridia bacterium]
MSKKLIVIIEIFVCAMAIIVISLFGLNPENWRDNVFASSIEFYEDDATIVNKDFDGTGNKKLQIELDKNTPTYQLKWRINPTNTSNTKVYFEFSGGIVQPNGSVTNGKITVTKTGLVVFEKGKVLGVTITVCVSDGTGCKDSVFIVEDMGDGTGDLPLE